MVAKSHLSCAGPICRRGWPLSRRPCELARPWPIYESAFRVRDRIRWSLKAPAAARYWAAPIRWRLKYGLRERKVRPLPMRTSPALLLIAVIASATSASAAIFVYPSVVELNGRNATQVLAVSAGERDVTAECTF